MNSKQDGPLDLIAEQYEPIDRVLEESTSQQLADEPSSPLLVLAAR